jgi:hypothetical protein
LKTAAALTVCALALGATPTSAPPPAAVAYPAGFRQWEHVKSTLLAPGAPRFDTDGGFHHIYANPAAMRGYLSRQFPDGSVIVFDWLAMREVNGLYLEGPRRQTDVMVKDATRFAATGGWGFQRFAGDGGSQPASRPTPGQCFSCHQKRQVDGLVLSRLPD